MPTVVTVYATDRDGDVLTYSWEVVWAEEGAVYWYEADGNTFTFMSATAPADYHVRVEVTDEHGKTARLTFPLHFVGEDGDCQEPTIDP